MRRQIEKFCNVFYIYKNYKMRVTVQIHKTAAKNKNVLLNWFCVVPAEDLSGSLASTQDIPSGSQAGHGAQACLARRPGPSPGYTASGPPPTGGRPRYVLLSTNLLSGRGVAAPHPGTAGSSGGKVSWCGHESAAVSGDTSSTR